MRGCIVCLAATGCVVLPKTSTTTRQVQTYESPIEASAPGALIVDARMAAATVRIQTRRARTCSRELRAVIETRSERSLSLVAEAPDEQIPPVLAVTELVVGPVSLLVSGVIVAASRPHREYATHALKRIESSCPGIAAGVPISIELPSGATVRRATDAAGVLAFDVPDGEPASGVVVVHAGTTTGQLSYRREPLPPLERPQ